MDTLITRKEYMANHFTHEQYYAQFVTPQVMQSVQFIIGTNRVTNSINECFNDIPLEEWDRIPISRAIFDLLKDAGDSLTPATSVCIAKAAAKQIRRENARPRAYTITVRYHGEHTTQCFQTDISGTVDGILDYYYSDNRIINIGKGGNDHKVYIVGIDFQPIDE